MVQCPNCHYEEINGALFCSECGTQLVLIEQIETQSMDQISVEPGQLQTQLLIGKHRPMTGTDTSISLYLVDSGHILHLTYRSEYSLGRTAEGQPIMPDVDLSPYDAHACGVSRLHASLKNDRKNFTITDLGSSNGTYLNNQKILPHSDFIISNGDVITLGKLKIKVFIHQSRQGLI